MFSKKIYRFKTSRNYLKIVKMYHEIFGEKFKKIPEGYSVASKDQWGDAGNPNTVLGVNTDLNESKFYEYVNKFMKSGATILGGCCEIRPSHIKRISKLK